MGTDVPVGIGGDPIGAPRQAVGTDPVLALCI
jgi:hypothetical protein